MIVGLRLEVGRTGEEACGYTEGRNSDQSYVHGELMGVRNLQCHVLHYRYQILYN